MSAGWKIPSPLIPPNLIISCSCLPTTVSRALLLCACAKDLTDTQSSDYCRELCVISHFPNLESLSHQSGSGLWALGSGLWVPPKNLWLCWSQVNQLIVTNVTKLCQVESAVPLHVSLSGHKGVSGSLRVFLSLGNLQEHCKNEAKCNFKHWTCPTQSWQDRQYRPEAEFSQDGAHWTRFIPEVLACAS